MNTVEPGTQQMFSKGQATVIIEVVFSSLSMNEWDSCSGWEQVIQNIRVLQGKGRKLWSQLCGGRVTVAGFLTAWSGAGVYEPAKLGSAAVALGLSVTYRILPCMMRNFLLTSVREK